MSAGVHKSLMRCSTVLAVGLSLLLVAYHVLPDVIRQTYSAHGHGDQNLTFWLVFGAFITPALWPVFQAKTLVFNVLLPDWVEGHLTLKLGALLLTPSTNFSLATAPLAPDYTNEDYWSLLPDRKTSQRTDAGLNTFGARPPQHHSASPAQCSAFYLHPSTWYTSAGWNGNPMNPITSYLADDAIGPQHAGAFNERCRLFAPRFRQMAAAGFLQPDGGLANANSRQALDLAYQDVKRAFEHFLTNYHQGEPIFLVGHSQGSILAGRLVKDFFDRDASMHKYLAVAYLPGWTFFHEDFDNGGGLVKVCNGPRDFGCIVTWRTFARGGNYKAFLHVEDEPGVRQRRVCTNPLSWRSDDLALHTREENLGGLHVMHYTTMWRYMVGGNRSPSERVFPPPLVDKISDAQCDAEGNLLITPPTHYGYGWGWWPFPSFTFAAFPGSNLHTYDFNYFFGNVQENVEQRVQAWWEAVNNKEKQRLT